ncbi:saccharopine dehydrogenase NADP-binding domain-containing protein [Hymenobacter sp. 15J16-1T3B]|uniref:saccharopine dehydrogenase family protein n=1 Tax=Hymenobacter sp. 15J16-1T3B TaxID=2886941 RepID=UPI001D107905|nr:saccharopine dehydrogenase C-terminal domain-containing protein [Hymenobacter sp. 15J16-1T3B]MCC3156916.1 saccharopine dehydrogenase NADP-binding domain-containing protein [Hymenobacter sp. 15J16-1T3B]
MTRILLLGAGRSASSLIQYLLRHLAAEDWQLTIADVNPEPLRALVAPHGERARAVAFEIGQTERLHELVAAHEVVVSMLPALFHPLVAQACLHHGRHLATASYATEEIRGFDAQAAAQGLTFLMECGLDPGLDHMSALPVIEEIRAQGGRLTSFKSYCGGLMAPDSEGDNPWRYKFTWNPRNVVVAGQGTARYIEGGHPRFIPYQQLFRRTERLAVPGYGEFEGYANRDSLSYRPLYGLDDIPTMLRGTLRRPGYCAAWAALVSLGLTDDSYRLGNAADLPWARLLESFLPSAAPGLSLAARTAAYLGLDPAGEEMQRLAWAGVFGPEPVGLPDATPAQLLEKLLTAKWQLQPHDHDMIVMQHLVEYEPADGGPVQQRTSSLVVTGDDAVHTAMAKTVGLPLGMAVRRLARGEISHRGVVVPVHADIYQPILQELETEYNIRFVESAHALA